MANILYLFYAAYTWFISSLKLTSLPKLYHRLSSKRGIPVKQLRLFEKYAIKYAKRQLDVHYLEYCFDLGLCPQTFKFKIPTVNAYKSTKEFYDVALKKQTDEARYDESNAGKQFFEMKSSLFIKLTLFEKTALMKLLVAHVAKVSEEVIIRHSRKLQLLWRKQRPTAPDCLVNLSSRKLTIEEEDALRYGLEHHILPSKVNADEIKLNVEKTAWIASKSSDDNDSVSNEFRHKMIHAVHAFCNVARNVCGSRRNRRKHLVLKRLSSDKTVKICKFDKGTGVCIMNSVDYTSKLDSILNDVSKFKKVEVDDKKDFKDHPIIKKYEKVKRYIAKYITDEHFDEKVVSKMKPGSSPGKLYGLVKVHKESNPLRPVCSMVDTPEYCLAKFLDEIIKPHIPNQYMLFSTKNFIEKLQQFSIAPGDKMVSFDVVSLFTNVPLTYTIDLIANYIYTSAAHPHFSKTVFKNMMRTATQGYFLFNDILYQQVDGVIMGSPLGPTMANFFLADMEKNWIGDICEHKPSLYLRYVDDIFAIFRHGANIKNFLSKINGCHPNIKFTIEEASETLPFLDVEIKLNENTFDSWVWRKKTHTGVLLNFTALAPTKWKFGLILCLLTRVWDICSSIEYFHQEVGKLRKMFLNNGYPSSFFDKAYEKFSNNRLQKNNDTVSEVADNAIYLKIPFIGPASTKFAKSVSVIFENTFDVKINPIYTTYKVKKLFWVEIQDSQALTL